MVPEDVIRIAMLLVVVILIIVVVIILFPKTVKKEILFNVTYFYNFQNEDNNHTKVYSFSKSLVCRKTLGKMLRELDNQYNDSLIDSNGEEDIDSPDNDSPFYSIADSVLFYKLNNRVIIRKQNDPQNRVELNLMKKNRSFLLLSPGKAVTMTLVYRSKTSSDMTLKLTISRLHTNGNNTEFRSR